MPDRTPNPPRTSPAVFATTRWSAVLAARGGGSPEAKAALDWLCRAYWYPLYAYVRRCGYQPEEAQDLTQAFFERFIEKDYLHQVAREKGRFRSFLLAALKHFLSDQQDKARAQKRGGRVEFVSLDLAPAEE